MKFFIKDFVSKCDQIRRILGISSHLLKKSLMENFIFCAVNTNTIFDNTQLSVMQYHNRIQVSKSLKNWHHNKVFDAKRLKPIFW